MRQLLAVVDVGPGRPESIVQITPCLRPITGKAKMRLIVGLDLNAVLQARCIGESLVVLRDHISFIPPRHLTAVFGGGVADKTGAQIAVILGPFPFLAAIRLDTFFELKHIFCFLRLNIKIRIEFACEFDPVMAAR